MIDLGEDILANMKLLIFIFFVTWSQNSLASTDFYKFKTGLMSYNIESIISSSGSNSSNFALEYGQYHTGTQAGFVEFRIALQSENQRVLYQAMSFGKRYYFLNSAYQFKNNIGNSLVEYSNVLAFYAHYKVGLGRYLVGVFGTQAINDGSVTFTALSGGTGVSYHIGSGWNVDLETEFEYDIGIFGPFNLSATNLFIQLGLHLDI